MKKLSWKPVRRGNIYCAPACGSHCTWAAYQGAVKRANEVAAELGSAWKLDVWENMGWHWGVHAKAGDFTLSVTQNTESQKFMCMISTVAGAGLPGIYADNYYPTAKKAVAESMLVFGNVASQYERARRAMDAIWMNMPKNKR